MIRLIKPTSKYKQSFVRAMKEFAREDKKPYLSEGFDVFLKGRRNLEKGKDVDGTKLPPKYVPMSYYWLMDGATFVGETTIRHRLALAFMKRGGHVGYGIRPSKRKHGYGRKILALALKKVKMLGIKKALITCDDDNIASWKIIEANGGILQNKIIYKGVLLRRYWIKL